MDCNVCGEEARPWHDKRRGEKGWCCTSKECTAGGRVTRYTAEWLREQIGKAFNGLGRLSADQWAILLIVLAVIFPAGWAIHRGCTVQVVKWKPIEQPCYIEQTSYSECELTGPGGCSCLHDIRSGKDVETFCSRDGNELLSFAARIGCAFGTPPVDGGAR